MLTYARRKTDVLDNSTPLIQQRYNTMKKSILCVMSTFAMLLSTTSSQATTVNASNAYGISNPENATWTDTISGNCANVNMPSKILPNTEFDVNKITFKPNYKYGDICTAKYVNTTTKAVVYVTVYKDVEVGQFISSVTAPGHETAFGAVL